jgi:glycosyltransferase involved in cell wall biosynthesis
MINLKDNLTVVIPCKNEGVGLANTLVKLLSMHSCNIIIADSSTDDTLDYIDQLVALGINDIKVVKGGLPAVARNNGFKEVKTPYVLFLDADMDVTDVPLHYIVSKMIINDIKLATCNITTWDMKYALVYKIFDLIQWIISFKTPFAVGGFMLFESQYFRELGGFDNEDRFAEDFHLSMKANPKYFKIFNFYASTSSRRFKNKGVLYMCKLMIRCWFNRHDDTFFKEDYNYWK